MRTPFLTKCENTMRVQRRATWDQLTSSRNAYARMPYPVAGLIALLADIELTRREARGDLTSIENRADRYTGRRLQHLGREKKYPTTRRSSVR